MNKVRLLTLGLSMALAFAQTAQASIYITPFGATQVYRVEESTKNTQETTTVAPEVSTEEIGPGMPLDSSETEAPVTQPQVPESAAKEENPVVLPSAVYSTKEPVTLMNHAQTAGPGAGSAADQTTQPVQAPQGIQTNVTTKIETIADLEKAATAAEIAIPEIAAQGAVLYDVTHDRFVFEKNADKQFYPASITKILTALLVLEHAKLDETVTYSETAVTKLESGAVTLQLQAGDKVSVKDSLYGLMLKSANEVANGLAEHVGGSLSGFADMMNAKAKELGCTGSNFVNPNGLNNSDHYTTARDMARIAKAAFENETLCKFTSTTSHKFPETKAAKARTISMGHKMLYKSDPRYYEGIVGGKTGYTSLAGNTLVTCVERDGVRMVAVILKSSGTHYTDTKALMDYGYALSKAGILEVEPETNEGEAVGPGFANTDNVQQAGPGAVRYETAVTAYHKWIADGDIWRFELADGTRLSNCLVTIDGVDYAFDTEGKMVTGWLTLGSNWHYFGSSGAMIKGDWRQDGSLWFYLGENGAMVRNAWIDNQYYVGADGVWVQ